MLSTVKRARRLDRIIVGSEVNGIRIVAGSKVAITAYLLEGVVVGETILRPLAFVMAVV